MINNKGFTLIETVVAMVVAGILLGSIYYAFSMCIKIANSGNEVLEVANIANKIYNDFALKKKEHIDILDDFNESGEYKDKWKYNINIKKAEINIDDKFDIAPEKTYVFLLQLQLDNKVYNFEYYFKK